MGAAPVLEGEPEGAYILMQLDDRGLFKMTVDSEEAKQVICQIIAAAGGRLEGKLRLFKAFYFAHLFYWQHGTGILTDHPIVRMPMGPGIDKSEALLGALQREGQIRVGTRANGPFREYVYELTTPVEIDPSNARYRAIEEAVEWVRDKSAGELSLETHLYSRSWRSGADGQVLDIYSDLLDDEEYESVRKGLVDAAGLIHDAFGTR
jgi:hypothetical protein